MTAPRYVSPCCGAAYISCLDGKPCICAKCGQPCDPMPADLRAIIRQEGFAHGWREGMERAAKIADSMLGNPSPDAAGGVQDGRSWNAACLRVAAAIRARGKE